MAQTLFDGSIIYALYLTIYLDVYYETMEEAEVGKIGPKSSLKQNPFPIHFLKNIGSVVFSQNIFSFYLMSLGVIGEGSVQRIGLS